MKMYDDVLKIATDTLNFISIQTCVPYNSYIQITKSMNIIFYV